MAELDTISTVRSAEMEALVALKNYFLDRRAYTGTGDERTREWDFCSKDVAHARNTVNKIDPYYKRHPIFDLDCQYSWYPNFDAGITKILYHLKMMDTNFNIFNEDEETVLHYYIRRRMPHITNAFIREGVDVNAQDCRGDTPLILVLTCSGETKTAKLLYKAGANFFLNNHRGENAYDYKRRGSSGICFKYEIIKKLDAESQKFLEYRYEENLETVVQATKNRDLVWLINIAKKYKGRESLITDAEKVAAEAGDFDFLEQIYDHYESRLEFRSLQFIVENTTSLKVVEVAFRYADADARASFFRHKDEITLKNTEFDSEFETLSKKSDALLATKKEFEKAAKEGNIEKLKEILEPFKNQPVSKRGGPRALRLDFSSLLNTPQIEVILFFNQLSISEKCYEDALYWAMRHRHVDRMVALLSKFSKRDVYRLLNAVLETMDRIIQSDNACGQEARKKLIPKAFAQLPVMQ